MLTKHLRRIPNARHFWFTLNLVFTVQYFKCSGLRCSPLNAALVCKRKNAAISQDLVVKVQRQSCGFGYQIQC
ncbi:hypothetical protein DA098_12485 [Vibrio parahaemolyticus]|nr:hypothetical protein DA098_12485 [Vibrio parahaemolyticus]TMX77605.1 hypothetical protein DA094_12195 [Vibrio parahaemolyticus]